MTDREKPGLRGPVHSPRQEFAELDLSTEQWPPARHYSMTVFLPDGRLDEAESHNPDGTVVQSVYPYDGAGAWPRYVPATASPLILTMMPGGFSA